MKLKRKLNSTKNPRKIKKIMIKLKKIYDKLRLNDKIKSKKNIYKSIKNKKFKSKK